MVSFDSSRADILFRLVSFVASSDGQLGWVDRLFLFAFLRFAFVSISSSPLERRLEEGGRREEGGDDVCSARPPKRSRLAPSRADPPPCLSRSQSLCQDRRQGQGRSLLYHSSRTFSLFLSVFSLVVITRSFETRELNFLLLSFVSSVPSTVPLLDQTSLLAFLQRLGDQVPR